LEQPYHNKKVKNYFLKISPKNIYRPSLPHHYSPSSTLTRPQYKEGERERGMGEKLKVNKIII
jgi:hypothetical protein